MSYKKPITSWHGKCFLATNFCISKKNYNSQQVLIRLIEEWREYLDKDFVIGAVLTDLSKAFDCIPHDLLIAKFEAYGLGEKASILYLFVSHKPKSMSSYK